MQRVDVVQHAIISLGHHRHGPCVPLPEMGGVAVDHPARRTMVHHAHTMGVGDADRPEEITRIIDPMGPGHLAIPIECILPSPDRLRVIRVLPGQNRRHPGAHPPHRIGQRPEPDSNPRHIGDRVKNPRRARQRKPQITGAWFIRSLVLHQSFLRARSHRPTAAIMIETSMMRVAMALISGFTPRRTIEKMKTGRVVLSVPEMK